MKFKRSQVEDVHINLTPMIDCLLFILVFLLLTTTFNQFSRMNLTLPDAQGVPPKTFDHKIEVVVDSTGHYSINGQSIASKDVSELNTAIKQISNDRRDLMFVIAAKQVEQTLHEQAFRHLGLYAYRVKLLQEYVTWDMGTLEKLESLEQLRVLENGHRIAIDIAEANLPPGVDTQEDLDRLNAMDVAHFA